MIDLKELVNIIDESVGYNSQVLELLVKKLSDRYDIGETFKKFGYKENWMLIEKHYKYILEYGVRYLNKDKHVVLELGTQIGSSAVCFAEFCKQVVTMDVNTDEISPKVNSYYKIIPMKIFKPEKIIECLDIFKSATNFDLPSLVFVDIGHDGIIEYELHKMFIQYRYKGLVFWDDISLDDRMKNFWKKIDDVEKIETKWHDACGFGITRYD